MFVVISIFNKMLAVTKKNKQDASAWSAQDTITVFRVSCPLKPGMPNEAYKIRQTVLENLN